MRGSMIEKQLRATYKENMNAQDLKEFLGTHNLADITSELEQGLLMYIHRHIK